MRRPETGLTLLEVLAAVMLLGIVYTLLATKSTEGIWNQGNSRRRLEASLLADQVLAEIETAYAIGSAPAREATSEERDDGFRIETSIENYRPEEPPPDPAEPTAARELQVGAADVFGDERGLRPGVLVQVRVRVSWLDLGFEKSVERLTWIFDTEAALALGGEGDGGLLETLQGALGDSS